MFDWIRGGKDNSTDLVPYPDYVKPKAEKPAQVYYKIGVAEDNRVSLTIGLNELRMNKVGVQNLIDQLTVFMNQLPDNNNDHAS